MENATTKMLAIKWKQDVESCLGIPLTSKELEDAIEKHKALYGKNNLLDADISSFVRDSLIDLVCIGLIGEKACQYGDSKEAKRTFNKEIKAISLARA